MVDRAGKGLYRLPGLIVLILSSACALQTGTEGALSEQPALQAETPTIEARAAPVGSKATLPPPTATFDAVGQDLSVELPMGDAQRGARYWEQKRWECSGCHELLEVGPPLEGGESRPGIATIAAERLKDLDYQGQAQTVEQYLLESIVLPGAYVVPGYADGLMPDRLADLMTAQEAADMIAFMMTLE